MNMQFKLFILLYCNNFYRFYFCRYIYIPPANQKPGEETYNNVMSAMIGRGIIIYQHIVIVLMISGGYMFTNYINSETGYFNTSFANVLWLKSFFFFFFLVLLIILG